MQYTGYRRVLQTMSTDAPVLQNVAAAPAAAAAVSTPADKYNGLYLHLQETLGKDVYATVQASVGDDGELYARIDHGGVVHDLPTFCEAVAATPTAYPEFLARPSTDEPTRCCAIVLSTNARCKLAKTGNDETCGNHVSQSLAPLLTDYGNRPIADKFLGCFRKIRAGAASSSTMRCIVCPRFVHAKTASHPGCVANMAAVAEDFTVLGICRYCYSHRQPPLLLMPVPDYGEPVLPHLKPVPPSDGTTVDDGMLGVPVAGATPLRQRPSDLTPLQLGLLMLSITLPHLFSAYRALPCSSRPCSWTSPTSAPRRSPSTSRATNAARKCARSSPNAWTRSRTTTPAWTS